MLQIVMQDDNKEVDEPEWPIGFRVSCTHQLLTAMQGRYATPAMVAEMSEAIGADDAIPSGGDSVDLAISPISCFFSVVAQ